MPLNEAERQVCREGARALRRREADWVKAREAQWKRENPVTDPITPIEAVAELLRYEMRHAENYVRPDSGVLRFYILPTHLSMILNAVESQPHGSEAPGRRILAAIRTRITKEQT